MTNDSGLFPPRWKWEEKGYRSDEYGNWLLGNWQPYTGPNNILKRPRGLIVSPNGAAAVHLEDVEDVALPLYQGVMIHKFDFAYKELVNSKGRKWTATPWSEKRIVPQYLMSRSDFSQHGSLRASYRVGFRGVARTTDQSTLISAVVPVLPCADKVPFLITRNPVEQLILAGTLNSTVDDWVQRQRQSGATLNFFLLEDLPLIPFEQIPRTRLAEINAQLSWCAPRFGGSWLELRSTTNVRVPRWALMRHERLRLRAITEAITGFLLGLDQLDVAHILADCDHPPERLAIKQFSRSLDPKGFWRIEKDQPPEHRLGVLSQIAFIDLSNKGLAAFCSQNDGEGWMLPETLRLADFGLGHDDRSKEHQPVAAALGPRFYPWQLEHSVEESWEECERHAEVLAKLLPPPDTNAAMSVGSDAPIDLFGNPVATDLFGDAVYARSRKR